MCVLAPKAELKKARHCGLARARPFCWLAMVLFVIDTWMS